MFGTVVFGILTAAVAYLRLLFELAMLTTVKHSMQHLRWWLAHTLQSTANTRLEMGQMHTSTI
jgi:hypothetical protein